MAVNPDRNIDPGKPPDDDLIEAVDFRPVEAPPPQRRWRPKPLLSALALAVLVTLVILLYLITARSLYVRTNAEQAQIRIDGLLTLTLADHFLLLPGDHRVDVSAPGYQPRSLTYPVSDAGTQYLDVPLDPLPGHLTVTTNVPARVLLDGRPLGNGGQRLTPIAAGAHQLRVEAERYLPVEQELLIEGRDRHQTLELTLQPAWAEVEIDSEPAGATLLADGQVLGTTPMTAQLDAGKHELRLQLDGFQTWQQILRVEQQQQLSLPRVALEPAASQVTLVTQPAGASVTLDEQFRGRTPLTLALAPGRAHNLALHLDGYQPLRSQLELEADEQRRLSYRLQPTLGDIRIAARPADALLYVDGVLLGRANQTLTLPTRRHRIRISKDGYADHSADVLPRAGLEQRLDITLLTNEQHKWKTIARQLQTHAGQTLLLFRPDDTFTMGASRREQGRRANESQYRVQLTRAFYLGDRLVTNAEYRTFDRFHSSGHVKGNSLNGDDQPVVNISWQQAALYCNWLSQQEQLPAYYQVQDGVVTGIDADAHGYRLPSEAEWAWAARLRDGAMLKYPWNGELPPPKGSGNFGDRSAAALLGSILLDYDDGFAVTAAAHRFPANHRGLYDIGGNAAEWINDYYGITTSLSLKAQLNPRGPDKGDYHVIRGSSWAHATITDLRLSFRDYGSEGRFDLGFRVARNVE